MRLAIAIALVPSLALADSSVGEKPKPQPAAAPWTKACLARLTEARAKAIAIDKTFAQGTVDLIAGARREGVSFEILPPREQEAPPTFNVTVYTDHNFAPVDTTKPLSPRLMSDGWYFLPNHPYHSVPPSAYVRHGGDRTAELVSNQFSYAIEQLWKRAAEDCLVIK